MYEFMETNIEKNSNVTDSKIITPEVLFSYVDNKTTRLITRKEFKKYYNKVFNKAEALRYQGKDGNTLIIQAPKSSKGGIAKFLTQQVTDSTVLDIQNNYGKTALHYTIINLHNGRSTFKKLIKKCAKCDIKDKNGYTVLDLINKLSNISELNTKEKIDLI